MRSQFIDGWKVFPTKVATIFLSMETYKFRPIERTNVLQFDHFFLLF